MIDLTEMQKMLNKVSCPACHASTIDVALRCDLGYGECIAVATCQTCGMLYEVSTEHHVLEEGRKEVGSPVCPHCDTDDCELEMRCELPSRQCFYVMCCRKCSNPFFPAAVKDA